MVNKLIQNSSPAELGYRMPGEFEPLEAIWLTYPHNHDTWPGCLELAQNEYDYFMSQAARFAEVKLIGPALDWPTTDSWIRDYGPIFLVHDAPDSEEPVAVNDFQFNGWGGKYGGAEQYTGENDIPRRVAEHVGVPRFLHDYVLEGGSLEVNGSGTVLTTRTCLLQRNGWVDEAAAEATLHAALGTRHAIWLGGGVEGDDTDGHIDNLARFVNPTTIAAVRASDGHPNYDVFEANWRQLEAARDQDGQPFQLVALPAPEPFTWDYPDDEWDEGGTEICPASYANFLIVNEAVLVPVFHQAADETACRRLELAFPGRQIIPVPARYLVVGQGGLHCLSQQQPKSPHTSRS